MGEISAARPFGTVWLCVYNIIMDNFASSLPMGAALPMVRALRFFEYALGAWFAHTGWHLIWLDRFVLL